MGILVPQPGIEPIFFALEGEVLTTGPPGKSQPWVLLLCFGMESPTLAFSTVIPSSLKQSFQPQLLRHGLDQTNPRTPLSPNQGGSKCRPQALPDPFIQNLSTDVGRGSRSWGPTVPVVHPWVPFPGDQMKALSWSSFLGGLVSPC